MFVVGRCLLASLSYCITLPFAMCVRVKQKKTTFFFLTYNYNTRKINSYQWSVVDGVRVQRHLGLPSGQRAGHKRRTPPDQRSPSLKAVSQALPPL